MTEASPKRNEQVVLLGCLSWDRPDWVGTFYPEGMPPEWRLTYYNTQFDCLFMERGRSEDVPASQWRQWLDDTHDEFRFLLEGGREVVAPVETGGKMVMLEPDDPRLLWFDRTTDLKAMSAALMAGGVRYLISRDGDLGQLERVRTLLELMGM